MSSRTYSTAKLVVIEPSEWKPGKGRVFTREVYFLPGLGGYSVIAATLPGCASIGRTFAEAKTNIREVMQRVIETYLAAGEKVPKTPDATPEGALTCMVSVVVGGEEG